MPNTVLAAYSVASGGPPSTPLGPWVDSAVAWTTWITLMGFVGLTVLSLAGAGAPARRASPGTLAHVTMRLGGVAAVLGVLAVPAVLTELAQSASQTGGYDYAAAWDSLYDGTVAGLYSGLEITFSLAGAALIAPLAFGAVAASRARNWLLGAGLAAGAVSLAVTKFPDDSGGDWGKTVIETVVWMMHLFGGAIWIGGLAGLLLLALPGAVQPSDRGDFWAVLIRRFSVLAMSCVAAIALSGLFLYWEHVDGPEQLFTTMYGRTLGVKIIIFGVLLLLGLANQFFLHPRIEALRAAGDRRALQTILVRRFPAVIAVELLLGMTVLFVAPFLHGSARNQAYQAQPSVYQSGPAKKLPKLPAKQASAATWAEGTAETIVIVGIMIAGYRVSGRLARRRVLAVMPAAEGPDPNDLAGR
jgi:putative copper export protein